MLIKSAHFYGLVILPHNKFLKGFFHSKSYTPITIFTAAEFSHVEIFISFILILGCILLVKFYRNPEGGKHAGLHNIV